MKFKKLFVTTGVLLSLAGASGVVARAQGWSVSGASFNYYLDWRWWGQEQNRERSDYYNASRTHATTAMINNHYTSKIWVAPGRHAT
ncbi:MAG: hypothetical protein LBI11_00085, partial [Streptococcaceae bacterium]|nr:hypothetical protein [Streptococcaceae bacterium]